jgi:hypothetical protein
MRGPMNIKFVKVMFRDDTNILYNYGMLRVLQCDRYAVIFMWLRDGTASLAVMISC